MGYHNRKYTKNNIVVLNKNQQYVIFKFVKIAESSIQLEIKLYRINFD